MSFSMKTKDELREDLLEILEEDGFNYAIEDKSIKIGEDRTLSIRLNGRRAHVSTEDEGAAGVIDLIVGRELARRAGYNVGSLTDGDISDALTGLSPDRVVDEL